MKAENENKPHVWRAPNGEWACFGMIDGAYQAAHGECPADAYRAWAKIRSPA